MSEREKRIPNESQSIRKVNPVTKIAKIDTFLIVTGMWTKHTRIVPGAINKQSLPRLNYTIRTNVLHN